MAKCYITYEKFIRRVYDLNEFDFLSKVYISGSVSSTDYCFCTSFSITQYFYQ